MIGFSMLRKSFGFVALATLSGLAAGCGETQAPPQAAPVTPTIIGGETAKTVPAPTPAKTEAAPAKTEAAPPKTEAAPAKTEAAPPKTEAAPAKTEAAPAKTEAAPAKTEAAPAKGAAGK